MHVDERPDGLHEAAVLLSCVGKFRSLGEEEKKILPLECNSTIKIFEVLNSFAPPPPKYSPKSQPQGSSQRMADI